MTNVVKKLKTNIKNIKNNKLDVIEEMLSLIILFMPFMISIFSIVKFYLHKSEQKDAKPLGWLMNVR